MLPSVFDLCGMALSLMGMFVAAFGYLPPVAGFIGQEERDPVSGGVSFHF
jgi:hypothetical protein